MQDAAFAAGVPDISPTAAAGNAVQRAQAMPPSVCSERFADPAARARVRARIDSLAR
jgi:hypothetical protein